MTAWRVVKVHRGSYEVFETRDGRTRTWGNYPTEASAERAIKTIQRERASGPSDDPIRRPDRRDRRARGGRQ